MKRYRIVPIVLVSAILISCGKSYNTEGFSRQQLEDLADEVFLQEDYSGASLLYTELMFTYPGAANTDFYLYRLGISEAGMRYWADALFYFNRVKADHPSSEWTDDCSFEIARTWWLQRHDYRKDLTPILNCREELTDFFLRYPGSVLLEEANALLDSVNNYLSMRALFIGEFYARRDQYDASLLYLREALNDYGDPACKADILIAMGGVYADKGNEYGARRAFQRAIDECELSEERLLEVQTLLEEL